MTFFKISRYDEVLDRSLDLVDSLDYSTASRWLLAFFNDCFNSHCKSWKEAMALEGIPGYATPICPDGSCSFVYDKFVYKLVEEPYT